MHLIVGLGNPGTQYKSTRHNVGFDILDLISEKYNITVNRIKFKGVYGEGIIGGEKVILLKPSTFMNLSGESVREAASFYKINVLNIIVLQDDISLEVGRMRIRSKGSAGGHNGLKSIILNLSSEEFVRFKIGVGQPKGELVSHVLGKFSKEERNLIDEVNNSTVEAIELVIKQGAAQAMNKFNGYKAELKEC
ncbi:MAG: aminoacyl-tRNA hydrolase [Clostridiaceae bacterium]|nr:aminoacyl-tRNA hydrolase [Clostridiaceae bacterium]